MVWKETKLNWKANWAKFNCVQCEKFQREHHKTRLSLPQTEMDLECLEELMLRVLLLAVVEPVRIKNTDHFHITTPLAMKLWFKAQKSTNKNNVLLERFLYLPYSALKNISLMCPPQTSYKQIKLSWLQYCYFFLIPKHTQDVPKCLQYMELSHIYKRNPRHRAK